MAAKKGGLGRGLDALFMDNAAEESSQTSAVKLKLMDIEPNREQPRRSFNDESLAELTESIAKHGVLQPLLVRPLPDGGYQLVAGERRWRAARNAGLTEVPVVVREMTDAEMAVLALVENLQREDLNPMDEAYGFRKLIEEFSLTQEEAAERVGKSRPAVANALRLLKLPEAAAKLLEEGVLSAGHARALLSFDDESKLLETARLIVQKGLSVREVERLTKNAAKPKAEKESKPVRRDAFFDEVELTLSETLCRKIKVTTVGKKEAGVLEIDFFDKDDLVRLSNALNSLS